MSLSSAFSRDVRLAYPVALLLLVSPMVELAARLWPVKLYLVQWRFQTELAVVNMAPIFLLGALLFAAISWASGSDRMLRVVAAVVVLYGICLLPVTVLMYLDGDQIRQMAPSESREAIRLNTLITMGKSLLGALAALSLALGAWRMAGDVADGAANERPNRVAPTDADGALLVNTLGN